MSDVGPVRGRVVVRARAEALALGELVAVNALAVAQPMFDLYSRNTVVLANRRARPMDLFVVAGFVTLALPLLAWTFELIVGRFSSAARRIVHVSLLGAFTALFVVGPLVDATSWGRAPVFVVAAGVGIGAAVSFARVRWLRTWLRFLAFGAAVFAIIFAGFSKARTVVAAETSPIDVSVAEPHRVVLVVLDELPLLSVVRGDGSGTIDADLVPNLAGLVAESTWYPRHAAVAPLTDVAVPSLLTGVAPDGEALPAVSANFPKNLFTLLERTYAIHGHESATQLCPIRLCFGRGGRTLDPAARIRVIVRDGVDLLRERLDPENEPDLADLAGVFSLDPDPLATAREFTTELRTGVRPRLDVLHVFLPHVPWQYLPDGRRVQALQVEPGVVDGRWASPAAANAGRARHLQQLQAADAELGRLLDRLRSLQAYDDALIVVTADHGVAFDSGEPVRGVSSANAEQIVWTPLIVKYPGQRAPVVDDRLARPTDVLPTIAEVIGVEIPWPVDGRSLLGEPAPDPEVVDLVDWDQSSLRPSAGRSTIEIPVRSFDAALAGRPSGAPDDPIRLFRVGSAGDLVGRRFPSIGADPRGSWSADTARLARVDTAGSDAAFADLAGTTQGVPKGTTLAIIVNGTVAGTAEVGAGASSGEWFARLWPGAVGNGANEVEVATVDGSGPEVRLRLLPRSD